MNLLASQEGTSKPGIKVWEDHDRRLLTCFIMTCLNQASFFWSILPVTMLDSPLLLNNPIKSNSTGPYSSSIGILPLSTHE